jgi:mRNA interferase HicA
MKRRDLIQHLEAHKCELLREGANHSVYFNPATGAKQAVPRHSEVKKHLARSICKGLSVEVPKGRLTGVTGSKLGAAESESVGRRIGVPVVLPL